MGAIKLIDNKICDIFQSFIKINYPIPHNITKITGITNEILSEKGRPLDYILKKFLCFVGDLPLVGHNIPFDLSFINKALENFKFGKLQNDSIDTLTIIKKVNNDLNSYKLVDIATYYNFTFDSQLCADYQFHRSLGDCYMTNLVFQKLLNSKNRVL